MDYTVNISREEKKFSDGGTVMLKTAVDRVDISGTENGEKIGKYFGKIADSVLGDYGEKTAREITDEYEKSEDKRKRFTFRPYTLSSEVTVGYVSDRYISFLLNCVFRRGGRVICDFSEGIVFSVKSGMAVPEKMLIKNTESDRKKRREMRKIMRRKHTLAIDSDGVPVILPTGRNEKIRADGITLKTDV